MEISDILYVFRFILDIAILSFVLYKAYEIILKSQALQILRALVIIGLIFLIAYGLKLETLTWLLSFIGPGILVGFAVIFQPELRKIILRIGQSNRLGKKTEGKYTVFDSIISSAFELSRIKRGMLVVFERHTSLDELTKGGTKLNAEISSALIFSIFAHDNPLHDAAVIIQRGRIAAAGCFLPLSEQYDIKKTFGTRHRAALGISEQTDAIVLVVSEETGAVSLAYDSKLHFDLTEKQISAVLPDLLSGTSNDLTDEVADDDN